MSPTKVKQEDITEHEWPVQLAASEAYWTPTRLSSATPLPVPTLKDRPVTLQQPSTQISGPTHSTSKGPDLHGLSLAAGFTTSLVPNLTVLPYSPVGKIFMTFGTENFVGSAWVIGEKTIATAGHCVYDKQRGGWAKNLLFVPQYNNGQTIGQWVIGKMASPNGWLNNTDFAFDLGFALTSSPVRPRTGKLGWMANYPPNQGPYTEIGYPASPLPGYPFDGQRMWQSLGDFIGGSTIIEAWGNLTGGCSGGPWAVHKDNDWRGNGVNSHRYSDSSRMYSPYFGQAFLNLIQWMKQNGGD